MIQSSTRCTLFGFLTCAVAIAGCGAKACRWPWEAQPAETPGVARLVVPEVTAPPVVDGELSDPDWSGKAAKTPLFWDVERKQDARPQSEARFLRDSTYLYVMLYAADMNVVSHTASPDEDTFVMRFTAPGSGVTHVIQVGACKAVEEFLMEAQGHEDHTWHSGMRFGVDVDDSLNNEKDEDEEWVVEAAIPWKSLGVNSGEPLGAVFSRCDTPRGATRRCGQWVGSL